MVLLVVVFSSHWSRLFFPLLCWRKALCLKLNNTAKFPKSLVDLWPSTPPGYLFLFLSSPENLVLLCCNAFRSLTYFHRTPCALLFSFCVFVLICGLSSVVQLIPGATAPAALPADHGRVALPLQALWQHGEHHRRRRGSALASRSSSLSKP